MARGNSRAARGFHDEFGVDANRPGPLEAVAFAAEGGGVARAVVLSEDRVDGDGGDRDEGDVHFLDASADGNDRVALVGQELDGLFEDLAVLELSRDDGAVGVHARGFLFG